MSGPSTTLLDGVDWRRADDETLEHLRQLLRINTTNPPGNELPAARYVHAVLANAGIESQVLEPAPGRGAVVARLRGNGERRPLMMLGHLDVVGAERAAWSTDPFGAEVRDGYLYGRGAIDDKGMVAVNLMTMLLLARHGLDARSTLRRDVIFVASADEESGGAHGVHWLVDHHRALIEDAELVLNEGGRVRVDGVPRYVAVQTAEKVPNLLRVTARGPAGHAAVPLEENAVYRLARALAAIGAHSEPVRMIETTRAFFGGLATVWPRERERSAMLDVASDDAARVAAGARVLSETPVFNAVLRTGISATVVTAGSRSNVIPAEAVATLDVRLLPGDSIDDVAASLRRAIADDRVAVEIARRGTRVPVSTDTSPLFVAIAETVRTLAPEMVTVPYLSTGATDSAVFRALGMQAYGVLPFPLSQDDEERMHGHDERIPLAALAFGLRLVAGAVARVVR